LIPRECKRLAEVDFPVAEVSKHSAREKSIRHGHPSTLHLWWARRPLAACRAMLMALLLPDPCDDHCLPEFKAQARRLLAPVPMVPLGPTDEDLRKALLKFIADFANWDNSANQTYLTCARGLVRAAHGEEPPLVVDPFAGGGSIPLEALRIGCDAFASDLNPVACLILKVLLEDIPRHGPGLADELRRVGKEIKEAAEKELAEFYPIDPDGARPIAYLWARTVRCEAPNCGAEIPLVRSFWLCKKANRKLALRYKVVRPKSGPAEIEFEIFTPKTGGEVPGATVIRARATCLACRVPLSPDRVRAQLSAQRGGGDVNLDERGKRVGGALLLAVVTLNDEEKGRKYRLATNRDYEALHMAMVRVGEIAAKRLHNGLNPVPDEPTPAGGGSGAGRAFSMRKYGINSWGDFFSMRQKLALSVFAAHISGRSSYIEELLLVLGKFADLSNSSCPWEPIAECPRNVLSNARIKPAWGFAEGTAISESSASFAVCVKNFVGGIESVVGIPRSASVQLASAQQCSLPDGSSKIVFTDPPYYDAIPYSDLSDMFYSWFRRATNNHPLLRNPFEPQSGLTPKCPEIIQDEVKQTLDGHPKDKVFFEESMQHAFAEARRVLAEDGVGTVVFAHKTTEGWEALISGILKGGWTVTASWPITTEMASRLRARESAALAASVHLVCRPRTDGGIGGWEDILRELPNRIGDWMERLSGEGIRGADLVFSCIGPALELFSKFDKVETAEGREVKLDEFLEKVWEVVGRTALQQVLGTAEARARNGAAAALEEDARLTALFLWTLQSTNGNQKAEKAKAEEDEGNEAPDEDEEEETAKAQKGYTLIYDVVRRFAQPLGIHLDEWNERIVEVKKGVVRLLSVLEREEQLFGTSGTAAVARTLERTGGRDPQYMLFPEQPEGRAARGRKPRRSRGKEEAEALAPRREATTLDRVHAAMLLQARGEATALRALLEAENERSPDFLRLANALSALYPKDSEEKRLLDAMLLAVPR
jgi:putative DNA methylase